MATGLVAQPMTKAERATALAALEKSNGVLLKAIEGVSEEQAAKKPAPDRWSVLECVEHLTLSERAIYTMLQKLLESPPADDVAKEKTRGKTNVVAQMMPDRSHKATAPAEIAPRGQFTTLAQARSAFQAARGITYAFIRSTDLPLHSHVSRHPAFGELDAYQWITLMVGHVERHAKQIEEVKATF